MKTVVMWGEERCYVYDDYYDSIEEAREWIKDAFGGQVTWNSDRSGHWCELYVQVELE